MFPQVKSAILKSFKMVIVQLKKLKKFHMHLRPPRVRRIHSCRSQATRDRRRNRRRMKA